MSWGRRLLVEGVTMVVGREGMDGDSFIESCAFKCQKRS